MLLEAARDWLWFGGTMLLGGGALAPRRGFTDGLEAWIAGVGFAVGLAAAGMFVVHAGGLDRGWVAALWLAWPVLPWLRRARLRELAADPAVRDALGAWALWCLGALALLALVRSFSGGAWMGDWEEHYQRPLLLLGLRAEDEEFRRLFTFTARPPVANLAEAALLWPWGGAFARHQWLLLLLNSLALFPVALWARTTGAGRVAAPGAALLLLLNPFFLQNSTYPWTKLIAAFYVLAALHLLFTGPPGRPRLCAGAALLALGGLTHYSSLVWAGPVALAWLWWRWRAPPRPAAGDVLRAAGIFAGLNALWFGWAVARYGLVETLSSNTSAKMGRLFTWQEHLAGVWWKLWNTLVPHPLRSFDRSILDQANPWTWFRDQVFYVYQSNLFFALGGGGLVFALWWCGRHRAAGEAALRRAWLALIGAMLVAGTAVHGHVDEWGLAHICLSPLILLGLAVAVAALAHWRERAWVGVLAAAGLLIDLVLGVALHFAATAHQLGRAAGQDLLAYIAGLGATARHNFWQQMRLGQENFAERLDWPWLLAAAVYLGALALLALRGHRAAPPGAPPGAQ